jgi:hypothetical protein
MQGGEVTIDDLRWGTKMVTLNKHDAVTGSSYRVAVKTVEERYSHVLSPVGATVVQVRKDVSASSRKGGGSGPSDISAIYGQEWDTTTWNGEPSGKLCGQSVDCVNAGINNALSVMTELRGEPVTLVPFDEQIKHN